MSIRQFQPDRAVEIMAPGYGSGYRIGGRLVLTAAHLLDGLSSSCEIRRKRSSSQEKVEDIWEVRGKVVWEASDLDIALIELPEKITGVEGVTFGKLPQGTAGEELAFQMYGYPFWGRTKRGQRSPGAAGGRQIKGTIYTADDSPDGLLVIEAERLPPEARNTDSSDWEGVSGAAVVCDGLVIAVQSRHQNPERSASLEASPLWKVYEDEQWCQLLETHGIDSEPKVAAVSKSHLTSLFKKVSFPVKCNPRTAVIISSGTSIITIILRLLGLLSPVELLSYDFFMRLSSLASSQQDDLIAIVSIRDDDLKKWDETEISDWKLLEILQKINEASPRVIGLDVFRDEPEPDKDRPEEDKEDRARIISYLEKASNNTISACQVGGTSDTTPSDGKEPPFTISGLNAELIGFSDVIDDSADTDMPYVRRQLLTVVIPERSCSVNKSLSYRIALNYLEDFNNRENEDEFGIIELESELGKATFLPVLSNIGGYSSIDDGGYQILVNYRVKEFDQYPASAILEDFENSKFLEDLKDKIVLIGYTSTEENSPNEDVHDTPIGKMSGVELHAHMIRNIISPLYNKQPLIVTPPIGIDLILIASCCLGGSLIGISKSRRVFIILGVSSFLIIFFGYLLAFLLWGWWLPLVPSIMGQLLSVAGLIFVPARIERYLIQRK